MIIVHITLLPTALFNTYSLQIIQMITQHFWSVTSDRRYKLIAENGVFNNQRLFGNPRFAEELTRLKVAAGLKIVRSFSDDFRKKTKNGSFQQRRETAGAD